MAWCPKCKCEYREGFTRCSDCGVDLVNNIEDIPEETADLSNVMTSEILLATVNDTVELSYITSMLEDEKIKYRVEIKGEVVFKQMYLGKNNSEKKIFVEEENVDRAIQIVESLESQTFVEK